ncbi:MAG: class I SAM-dependent methyltransferase [Magnetococcales bacterium]|nr:class I SAM-dependent methyltransferase [Magnetococcales bacterium]MBF0321680.1 class I SAM-dependent methyltransferase [Magnetococcales bacterium]
MQIHEIDVNPDLTMEIDNILNNLKRSGCVYHSHDDIFRDRSGWLVFQKHEMDFWRSKTHNSDYQPDPLKNFINFFKHWGVENDVFSGKTVLEIGTGPFGFFSAVKKLGDSYLPVHLFMLDPLMDFYQQLRIFDLMPANAIKIQGVGEKTPFPNHFFDIIVTTNTLDHVDVPDKFIFEMSRILKKDGMILLSVHTVHPLLKKAHKAIKIFDKNHPYHFTPLQVEEIFVKNGFCIDKKLCIPIYKEDPVPQDISIWRQIIFHMAFRVMDTFYARVISNKEF